MLLVARSADALEQSARELGEGPLPARLTSQGSRARRRSSRKPPDASAPRIRVNSLVPGRFETAYVRQLDRAWAEEAGITEEEQRRASRKRIPMGRYGDPQEFARAATFLLSPAASYITGASLQIDGGLVTAIP